MAAPAPEMTTIGVLEVGLDGQVVTEESGAGMETRQLLLSTLDRSTSQPMDTVGGQVAVGDFDTDGNAYLYTSSVNGMLSQRWLWAPGMTEPLMVEESDSASATSPGTSVSSICRHSRTATRSG